MMDKNQNRSFLGKIIQEIKNAINEKKLTPLYKVVEIIENDGEYSVVIKLSNKNMTFNAKPEEILANDSLVDQFSPRDIRTLTYLGYLGINGPKYKILAKKLSEAEKVVFLLKKKGEKKVITKTADQIIQESDIILNLGSEDAKTVGYTMGSENILDEKRQKENLLKKETFQA